MYLPQYCHLIVVSVPRTTVFDLYALKEMERDINLHRRNLMHHLNRAAQAMSDNLIIINANFDDFVQANPNIADNFANVRHSLQTFQTLAEAQTFNHAAYTF